MCVKGAVMLMSHEQGESWHVRLELESHAAGDRAQKDDVLDDVRTWCIMPTTTFKSVLTFRR